MYVWVIFIIIIIRMGNLNTSFLLYYENILSAFVWNLWVSFNMVHEVDLFGGSWTLLAVVASLFLFKMSRCFNFLLKISHCFIFLFKVNHCFTFYSQSKSLLNIFSSKWVVSLFLSPKPHKISKLPTINTIRTKFIKNSIS